MLASYYAQNILGSQDACILNMPIISTSANISGQKPILTPEEILDYFSNNIDYIVDGKIGESKKPTRILDLITKEVLREGG